MKDITIRTPHLTTNQLYTVDWRSGRRILTKASRETKKAYALEAKLTYTGKEPLQGPLSVRIDLYFPDGKKRDLDNIKALIDSMKGILWEDDSQIQELKITKQIDALDPRIVISFKEQP